MTPLSRQLVDSSERTLLRRQYGNRELEITWEQNSGRLQGFLHGNGKAISVTLSGLPKRRITIEELPLVKNYLEGAVVRLHDRDIDIWPRLLGGAKRGNENAEKFILFISYDSRDDSSRNAVNGIKEEIEKEIHSSIVFKEEPQGASEWQAFIQKEIQKADLVLLYITKKYLKSNFCLGRIFEAMKALGDEWAKKMRIICDSEMQELLKTSEAWFQYLNECADFWEKEHETIEKGVKDATVGVQMALASEREYLYRNRADIPSFIQGIRIRNRSTVEDLKKDITGLIELKRVVAEKSSSHLPEICKDIPLLPTFTGREKLLRQMEENLRLTEKEKKIHKTKVVVLSGLGGVGKTQLAAKFMEDHLEHYNLVWTFDAESELMLQQGYGRLAQKLKLVRAGEKTVPPEEILEMVNDWLQAPENHGWLLCFDNADSLEIVQPKNLPQHGGEILITSRPKTHWENFYPVIGVQEFEREESNDLLKKIIPEGKQEGQEQLNVLAEELGDFPLALDQAGSYIKNDGTGLTTSEYVQLFRQTQERLAIWEEDKEQAVYKPYSKTVATTWEITMNYIKKKFPDSAEALNFCAFLNPNGIPQRWLEDWWKEKKGLSEKLESVLRRKLTNLTKPLIDFSLLYWEKPQVLLRIHRLVQLVTQDNLEKEERVEFIREALGLVEDKFDSYDDEDPKTWEIGKECLPHAVSVTGHILKEKGFLENSDLQEIFSTEIDPEITVVERANFHKEIFHASEQGKTTLLFHQMAMYANCQGNAFQAKGYYTKELEIDKTFLGDNHPKVAITLNNLGNTWNDLGEYKKAIECFTQALEIFKAVLGDRHTFVAKTLDNLGNAWGYLGENKKAIQYYTQALRIKKDSSDNSNPQVALTLDNLGNAWRNLGEHQKAIAFHEQALEIYKAFHGAHHPSVARTLNNLGTAWCALGEKKKAIAFYTQALEIFKAHYGESHSAVADTLNNLGVTWGELGENQKAIEFYEKALEMTKSFHDAHHPSVADTLNNLGTAWSDLGENKKAIEYYTQALVIKKAVFGDSHPNVASTLNNLGNAWSALGENQKATQYFTQAYTLFQQFYGEDHPHTQGTQENLNRAVWEQLLSNCSIE